MRNSWSSSDAAIEITCPTCKVGPNRWCVYVGQSVRAGHETRRLHSERGHQFWLRNPQRSTTRPHPALLSLRKFDQHEEALLRRWLRQYVHLLLEPGSAD